MGRRCFEGLSIHLSIYITLDGYVILPILCKKCPVLVIDINVTCTYTVLLTDFSAQVCGVMLCSHDRGLPRAVAGSVYAYIIKGSTLWTWPPVPLPCFGVNRPRICDLGSKETFYMLLFYIMNFCHVLFYMLCPFLRKIYMIETRQACHIAYFKKVVLTSPWVMDFRNYSICYQFFFICRY